MRYAAQFPSILEMPDWEFLAQISQLNCLLLPAFFLSSVLATAGKLYWLSLALHSFFVDRMLGLQFPTFC